MTSITVIGAGTGNAELRRQNETAKEARGRLWGVPAASEAKTPRSTLFVRASERPGANLPRDGEATFRGATRKAVDFVFAMDLVCADRQLTREQMLDSHYCAAVAARHMFWTVLVDGGHPVADIARRFRVDHHTVTLGIKSFREFQKGNL